MIEKKQIPNILSVVRLLMIPVFAVIFFADFYGHKWVALAVFIAAELTDVVDGYLARKHGWITDAGKILDPLADKLMQATAFVCIAIKAREVIVIAAFICVKELLMLAGGLLLTKHGAKNLVVSKWYGKLSSCIIAVAVGVLVVFHSDRTVTTVTVIASAAAMLFSLVMYLTDVFLRYFREDCKSKAEAATGTDKKVTDDIN